MHSDSLKSFVSRKQAVIFDLFHTLTAPEMVLPEGKSTSEILGLDGKRWNSQLMEKSRNRLIGLERDPYQIIKNLAHAIDANISHEQIQQAVVHRMNRFENALVHMPEETISVIRQLKQQGKKIALVSNADVIESAAWNRSPVSDFFDIVIFSCEVGFAKPEVEIYALCLQQLHESPANCVFVGDGGSHEFSGARKAGLPVIMVTGIVENLWPDKLDEIKKEADYVIRKLEELI